MSTPTSMEQIRARIPDDCLHFTFSRSSGPGGQNVNKVSTRVTLEFDLAGAHFTGDEKSRVRRMLGSRLGASGQIRVVASRHRTQSANRRAAVERLIELLADALRPRKIRRATRVPRRAHERRLQGKRVLGEKKAGRRGGSQHTD